MMYSIGLNIGEDGDIRDVHPDLAAARAGVAPGMKIVTVGGKPYSLDEITRAAQRHGVPVQMKQRCLK